MIVHTQRNGGVVHHAQTTIQHVQILHVWEKLRIRMQQAIADGDQTLANQLTLQYMDRVRDISSHGG